MGRRRRGADELRLSEERLRLAVAAGDIAIWEWFPRTGATYWDDHCLHLWDYPSGTEPSMGRFVARIHPDDRERVKAVLAASLEKASGGKYEALFRVVRESGEARWILARGQTRFDASGQAERVSGTLFDVSEREALREAGLAGVHRAAVGADLLRRLVESTDPAESLRAVCEETARALRVEFVALRGIDPTTGRTLSAHTHGAPPGFTPQVADPAAREAFLRRHGDVAGFRDLEAVSDLPGRDGLVRAGLRSIAHARMVSHGATIGLLFAATFREEHDFDAGELVFLRSAAGLASVALSSARVSERYRQIVTVMSESVLVADAHGRITYASPAAARFFEAPADALQGMRLEDFAVPGDPPLPPVEPASTVAPHRETRRFRTRSGREVWASFARLVFAAPGEVSGSLAILADVTETRALDAKLEQAQRLESLGVLAGGIAHDFNNLLGGILGNAEVVGDQLDPDHPAQEALADVRTAARRAADLTAQLLAYAGKGRLVNAKLDLRRLAEDVVQLLRPRIAEAVVLRVEAPPALACVEGDPTQVRKILTNLVANGADAIGGRAGQVVVRLTSAELGPADLARMVGDDPLPLGHYVVLEVADDGVGMTAETRARIFEPFFTTKFTGRGLGLASTLGVLRSHRAGIEVSSKPGVGTRVRLWFPEVPGIADAAETPNGARPVRPVAEAPAATAVLVVDDEEGVRRAMRRILERAGHRVLVAVDGDEALDVLRGHLSEIGTVVLDLTMPKMSGEETLRQLRVIAPELPVVLTSGYSESESSARFDVPGIAGFVAKPFTPEALAAKVREALGRAPH